MIATVKKIITIGLIGAFGILMMPIAGGLINQFEREAGAYDRGVEVFMKNPRIVEIAGERCPVYFEANFISKFVKYGDLAWCEKVRDRM